MSLVDTEMHVNVKVHDFLIFEEWYGIKISVKYFVCFLDVENVLLKENESNSIF